MKRFLFLTVLLIASMQLFGANVDLATARATAQQYAASKMAKGKLMAPSAIDMKLVKQEMNSDKPGTAVYYIFNTNDHFIIISGDREQELYGRYEEQAYFWRMLKLVGHKDVSIYEMQGYDHGAMPHPAYHILKEQIKRLTAPK